MLSKYAACGNDNISISKLLDVVGLSKATLHNILKDYQERGIDCIYRKKRKTPPVEAKITGEVEAHFIASPTIHPQRDTASGRSDYCQKEWYK